MLLNVRKTEFISKPLQATINVELKPIDANRLIPNNINKYFRIDSIGRIRFNPREWECFINGKKVENGIALDAYVNFRYNGAECGELQSPEYDIY